MFKVLHVRFTPFCNNCTFLRFRMIFSRTFPVVLCYVAGAPLQGLGCDMLQVGSTNDPSTSGDYNLIADHLRELADEAAQQNPPIRM